MKEIAIAIVIGSLTAATPSSAHGIGSPYSPISAEAEAWKAPAPPVVQASSAPERKICRTEAVLGSILPRHICATRERWDELVRANEADADILRFSQHPNAPTQRQQQGLAP